MTQNNFENTFANCPVFMKKYENGDSIILLLVVDDMLVIERDKTKITTLRKSLTKYFVMKDMGPIKMILG